METKRVDRVALFKQCSLHTFPFEGNGNFFSRSCSSVFQGCSRYTLSRLKGMETLEYLKENSIDSAASLHTFPFEGNGNDRCGSSAGSDCGDVSLHTFPVEGNGNCSKLS